MKSNMQLDFINQPAFSLSSWSVVGIIVLLLSLTMTFFTWQLYETTTIEQNTLSLKLSQVNRLVTQEETPLTVVTSEISQEQLKQIQTTVGALTIPWDGLLQSIEKSDMQDIALLNLEPNSKKQLITISGEAKSLQVALDYIQKLEAQPMLDKVYLQKYNIDEANQFKPVKFTLSTQWLF